MKAQTQTVGQVSRLAAQPQQTSGDSIQDTRRTLLLSRYAVKTAPRWPSTPLAPLSTRRLVFPEMPTASAF